MVWGRTRAEDRVELEPVLRGVQRGVRTAPVVQLREQRLEALPSGVVSGFRFRVPGFGSRVSDVPAAVRAVQFSIQEQLPSRHVERFRGGLVFKAHRLLYHSTLGSRVIKKRKKRSIWFCASGSGFGA